jgi:hypothetical protein
MSFTPDTDRRQPGVEEPAVRNATAARQGRPTGRVRFILLISVAAAAAAMGLIYLAT